MSAAHERTASGSGVLWWSDSFGGLIGYFGKPSDGLAWMRHAFGCNPGLWAVGITGWKSIAHQAVVDDFGNLVKVDR